MLMLPLGALVLLAAQETPPIAPPPPAAPSGSPVAAAEAAPATKATEKLIELRSLLEDDQCDKLVPLSPYVEDHRLATPAERHEAMFMRAYCLVNKFGNLGEASAIFNEILVENIDAQPPFDVEPRFQVLVDGARATILENERKRKAAQHAEKIQNLKFDVITSPAVKGGNRVFFDVKLTDPDAVVRSMRVDFRKKGDLEFYALPVARRSDGTWHGEVPGAYTRSTTNTSLEWYLSISGSDGDLLTQAGTRDKPNVMEILPGSAVAEDLKANERLPQMGRIFLAIGAPLALTGGAYTLSYALPKLLLPSDDNRLEDDVAANLSPALFALGASLSTIPVNFVSAGVLLDGSYALVAPAIVTAFNVIIVLSIITDYQTWVAFAHIPGPPDFSRLPVIGGPGPAIGFGAAIVSTLAATATTTILVAIDPPAE